MKTLKNTYSIILLCALFMFSCKEDIHGPINDDSRVPGPVKEVHVKNMAGSAEISYEVPADEGLLYVKAVYEVNGQQRETKSSFSKNYVVVDGFGEAKEYEVTLYAVSRSEKESVPVKVKINPLTPPIIVARNSLAIQATFGGINVAFQNPTNDNITIQVLRKDIKGGWVVLDNYYTNGSSGNFSVRGQEVSEITFGVLIKDRWNNRSDTLTAKHTPLFEEEIPKNFKDARFPGEAGNYSNTYVITRMWDKNLATLYHTPQNIPIPLSITFDMQVTAKLRRYRIWQRQGETFAYGHGNPHRWELWGSTNPDTDGGYKNWVLLGSYVMEKPSGSAVGINTAADLAAQIEGQEYQIRDDAPAVRFLRWKHLDNWSSIDGQTGFLHIAEINLWGKVN
ncbi:hypothetical protein AAKU52_001863 [Pedobacter sp. CG_S7]|uniref:DUF5000 domain-containing lipoprotein n=1 Tax=Pedobacter sp. CG_S7 TaxID=3143930 RepID=UPI00339506E4